MVKVKKLLFTGLVTGLLLVPTAALASEDVQYSTGSSVGSGLQQEQPAAVTSKALQAANLQASGNIVPITAPTPEYTANTTKFDLSSLWLYSKYPSIADDKLTVTFSSQMQKLNVTNGWWADWGPDVESRNPDVLFSDYTDQMTWTLSKPATSFGFEMATNSYGTHTYTVDYYSGEELVGSLTQTITSGWPANLKVFGAKASEGTFDRVTIRNHTNGGGFAVAQIRYSLDNTAPETYATLKMVKNNFHVNLAATDDITGVANTEYRVDGGDWKAYTGQFTVGTKQKLEYRSVDNAGNVEDAHYVGTDSEGFRVENVYVKTSDGRLLGPITQTLNSQQFLDLFLLGKWRVLE
ncbi:OmpL47-type beta-barrel domain-containing protein [Fictibacillus aquaticus]|uniref:Uncharacterized protein n=1 Tax=Fictibacillus aquaticus TaxID=2021314 RepID=A0A235F9E4_9BACL|nr:hypothetical protein [Fictibacillus aquaticus]OYD57704.1 hypothetical protein CGZ90_13655 [Fictibacillus aquaticus]